MVVRRRLRTRIKETVPAELLGDTQSVTVLGNDLHRAQKSIESQSGSKLFLQNNHLPAKETDNNRANVKKEKAPNVLIDWESHERFPDGTLQKRSVITQRLEYFLNAPSRLERSARFVGHLIFVRQEKGSGPGRSSILQY